jgi:hypothetical protein
MKLPKIVSKINKNTIDNSTRKSTLENEENTSQTLLSPISSEKPIKTLCFKSHSIRKQCVEPKMKSSDVVSYITDTPYKS